MKYLGMVHIGKLACVAIHNLEAIFTIIFTLQSYFTKREIIYNANVFQAAYRGHVRRLNP